MQALHLGWSRSTYFWRIPGSRAVNLGDDAWWSLNLPFQCDIPCRDPTVPAKKCPWASVHQDHWRIDTEGPYLILCFPWRTREAPLLEYSIHQAWYFLSNHFLQQCQKSGASCTQNQPTWLLMLLHSLKDGLTWQKPVSIWHMCSQHFILTKDN